MEYYDVTSWESVNGQAPAVYYLSYMLDGKKGETKATPGMVEKLYYSGAIRNIATQVKTWLNLSNKNTYYKETITVGIKAGGSCGGSK